MTIDQNRMLGQLPAGRERIGAYGHVKIRRHYTGRGWAVSLWDSEDGGDTSRQLREVRVSTIYLAVCRAVKWMRGY